jgi:hypothetical protein
MYARSFFEEFNVARDIDKTALTIEVFAQFVMGFSIAVDRIIHCEAVYIHEVGDFRCQQRSVGGDMIVCFGSGLDCLYFRALDNFSNGLKMPRCGKCS